MKKLALAFAPVLVVLIAALALAETPPSTACGSTNNGATTTDTHGTTWGCNAQYKQWTVQSRTPVNTAGAQDIWDPKTFHDATFVDGGLFISGNVSVGGTVTSSGTSTGADAGFRNINVAGDAGIQNNAYVAGAITTGGSVTVGSGGTLSSPAMTLNGSPVASYANGQAGGSIEMYHPTAYTGAKAVARVVEHPINANTQVSLSWVPQVAGSVGGTMAVYLKDVTAGNHVIAGLNSISCTSVAGTLTGALYLADGGADAGDTIGIYVDVSSCSGTIPDGTADVSW